MTNDEGRNCFTKSFLKQTEYIYSTFDVKRSMFDVHQFLFRLDWTLADSGAACMRYASTKTIFRYKTHQPLFNPTHSPPSCFPTNDQVLLLPDRTEKNFHSNLLHPIYYGTMTMILIL